MIESWALRLLPLVVEAIVASPHSTPGDSKRGSVNYKHFLELWLDTLRDEYEQEASRSPLERGVLLGENRRLQTCFAFDQDGQATVSSSDASVSPLVRVPIDLGDLDIGGVRDNLDATRSSVRDAGVRDCDPLERARAAAGGPARAAAEAPQGAGRDRRPGASGASCSTVWRSSAPTTTATSTSTRPPTSCS